MSTGSAEQHWANADEYRKPLQGLQRDLKWVQLRELLLRARGKPLPTDEGTDRRKSRVSRGLERLARTLLLKMFRVGAGLRWPAGYQSRFTPDDWRRTAHAELSKASNTSIHEVRANLAILRKIGWIDERWTRTPGIDEQGNPTPGENYTTTVWLRVNVGKIRDDLVEMRRAKKDRRRSKTRHRDPLKGFTAPTPLDPLSCGEKLVLGAMLNHLANWRHVVDQIILLMKGEEAARDARKKRIPVGTANLLKYLIGKAFALDLTGAYTHHPERFDDRGFKYVTKAELAKHAKCTPKELRTARELLRAAGVLEETQETTEGEPRRQPLMRLNFRAFLELCRRVRWFTMQTPALVVVAADERERETLRKHRAESRLDFRNYRALITPSFLICTRDTASGGPAAALLQAAALSGRTEMKEKVAGRPFSLFSVFLPGEEEGVLPQSGQAGEAAPTLLPAFAEDQKRSLGALQRVHGAGIPRMFRRIPADWNLTRDQPQPSDRCCLVPLEVAVAAYLLHQALRVTGPGDEMSVTLLLKICQLFRSNKMSLDLIVQYLAARENGEFESEWMTTTGLAYLLKRWHSVAKAVRPRQSDNTRLESQSFLSWCDELPAWLEVARRSLPHGLSLDEHKHHLPLLQALAECDQGSLTPKRTAELHGYFDRHPESFAVLKNELPPQINEGIPPKLVERWTKAFRAKQERAIMTIAASAHGREPAEPPVSRGPSDESPALSFVDWFGSHLRPGTVTLLLAVSGGGKTLCACQTAAHLALGGQRVLFLRGDDKDLEPRFKGLREEVDEETLSHVVSNFSFGDLEQFPLPLVASGAHDLIIADGLADLAKQFHVPLFPAKSYQTAMAALRRVAMITGIPVLVTAQLHPDASGRRRLTPQLILEGPGILEFADTALAVSSLPPEDPDAPNAGNRSKKQFVEIIKGPHEGRQLPFLFDGANQRFSFPAGRY